MGGWRDPEQWQSLRDGSRCWTCADGPSGVVIAEGPSAWVTTRPHVACRGYLCIYTKRHVVELYDLTADELQSFFATVAAAARAVDDLLAPAKINYEIHGNTNPHLHLHLFPRYPGDPFEGGPIRPSELHVTQSDDEIGRLADAVRHGLA